jgi:hypothetical protein
VTEREAAMCLYLWFVFCGGTRAEIIGAARQFSYVPNNVVVREKWERQR